MSAKIFEIGDVLPIGRVKINWDASSGLGWSDYQFYIEGTNSFMIGVVNWGGMSGETVMFISGISGEPVETHDLVGSYTISLSNEVTITDVSSWIADFFTWEVAPPGFSVTFEENGGTTVTDLTEQTALPNPLPTPTKENHTFLGWYYDSDFTNEAFADDPLTGDVTLYAKWEEISLGYTITFDSNGGSIVPQTSNATQLPDPLPITTKPGYTFVAWYIDSALTTRAVAGATIEEDTTLYAKWHTLGSLFTEIADAIRSKDGTSESIRDVDFGERVKQIQGAKEEQTKTVSPTTSSQDVLPDSGKVLSKVTVNAIPTETKSQQPNLSSGNQTINATSGKFMTSFTITKDTINHIASNIRSGITLYGVTGNLQPAKEEETKTVTPNFSSGNVVVTPTSGKVMTQVTFTKDTTNHIADNIKDGVTLYGVTGTLKSGGGGWFDYSISGSFTYDSFDVSDPICLVFLFGKKSQTTTIGTTTYYMHLSITAVTYILETPYADSCYYGTYDENLTLRWDQEVLSNAINFKAPFDPAEYECLGLYFASQEYAGSTTLTMSGSAYNGSKTTPTAITNGNIFQTAIKPFIYATSSNAFYGIFSISNFVNFSIFYWFPKLTNISLYVEYDD